MDTGLEPDLLAHQYNADNSVLMVSSVTISVIPLNVVSK